MNNQEIYEYLLVSQNHPKLNMVFAKIWLGSRRKFVHRNNEVKRVLK